jgi:SAM-dependent methyltransferase
MKIIRHEETIYPSWQATGNAARFIMPFAKEVCVGEGYDIGCNRLEWALNGAIPVDEPFDIKNGLSLPDKKVDYIFSSHCLEHVPHWVDTLDYWIAHIKKGGHLFLYLPDFSQTYWRPWNNRKHIHSFTPELIRSYLDSNINCELVFVSGIDLNNSFCAVCEIS